MWQFRQKRQGHFSTAASPARRRRNIPLQVEALEARALPTVLVVPQLGLEGVAHGNQDALAGQNVHLIYWGSSSYWTAALRSQFDAAASNLLSTTYLSGTAQYGSWGTATYADSTLDTSSLPGQVGVGNCEDEVENLFNTGGSNGDMYVIITPLVNGQVYPESFGTNTVGDNWVDKGEVLPNPEGAQNIHMIWDGNTANTDNFTWTLSHEMAEEMSCPNGGGFAVHPGALFNNPNISDPGQIGDYEPNLYNYRLANGAQVQPYFSKDDGGLFIVPDGNLAKQFVLFPVYSALNYQGFTNQYDLIISGSNNSSFNLSTVTVNINGSSVQELSITVNGETGLFDAGYLRNVTIAAGTGSSLGIDGVLSGYWKKLYVLGLDLQVNYLSPASTGTVNVAVLGKLTVFDTLGDAPHQVTVTGTTVTADSNAPLQYFAGALEVHSQDCTVTVQSSLAPVSLITTTNDKITVGSKGMVSSIHGPVAVEGGGNLTVDDSLDPAPHIGVALYTATNSSDSEGNSDPYGFISGLAPATISYEYADIQSVTILGGSSNADSGPSGRIGDTFYVEATGIPTTLITGPANDTVNVGSLGRGTGSNGGKTLDGIQGLLTMQSKGGNDTVNLNDQGTTASETYDINFNASYDSSWATVSRGGAADIVMGHMPNVVLNGGNHGNSFTVNWTPVGTSMTLNSGTGSNSFAVGGGQNLDTVHGPLTVNGQGAGGNLDLNDQQTSGGHTYKLTTTSLARSSAALIRFIGNLANVNVHGGAGSNTLTGGNFSTWAIKGTDAGVWGSNVHFTAMQNLVAGSSIDHVQFVGASGRITGSLTGGILDYSLYSGPAITVNLQTQTAPRMGGAFSGLAGLIGSPATSNTLIAADTANTWSIFGNDAGDIGGLTGFLFSGVEALVGGKGLDVFQFSGGGSVVSIDGGGAPTGQGDWLDYSSLATAVTVNLATGAATGVNGGVPGAVANIQNVHGGSGLNTFTGDAQGNILIGGHGTIVGGSGRSLLIGDSGTNTIQGGSGGSATGGDILIGGATSYDSLTPAHLTALMTIFAEWQSADSYDVRFSKINTGALPGGYALNYGTTVFGGSSTLSGAPGSLGTAVDWFFAGPLDQIAPGGFEMGEHVNNT